MDTDMVPSTRWMNECLGSFYDEQSKKVSRVSNQVRRFHSNGSRAQGHRKLNSQRSLRHI